MAGSITDTQTLDSAQVVNSLSTQIEHDALWPRRQRQETYGTFSRV